MFLIKSISSSFSPLSHISGNELTTLRCELLEVPGTQQTMFVHIDLSLLLSRRTKRHILNNRRSALKQRLKSKNAVQRPFCEREHYRVAQRRHQGLGSFPRQASRRSRNRNAEALRRLAWKRTSRFARCNPCLFCAAALDRAVRSSTAESMKALYERLTATRTFRP